MRGMTVPEVRPTRIMLDPRLLDLLRRQTQLGRHALQNHDAEDVLPLIVCLVC